MGLPVQQEVARRCWKNEAYRPDQTTLLWNSIATRDRTVWKQYSKNRPPIRQAFRPMEEGPLNVIVCTPRHRKMGTKTWIARHSLQGIKGARTSWHKRQLRARDCQSSSGNWIRERPTLAHWLDKDTTLECAAFCARGREPSLSVLVAWGRW